MNVVEFFQQSAGKWFSQRTSHLLTVERSQSGKSDLVIEMLSSHDPVVIQLCQQHHVDPTLALCGARVTWNGSLDGDKDKQQGGTVLVPIADSADANQGKILRDGDQASVGQASVGQASVGQASVGQYIVGTDEALTLITQSDTLYSEERLWFASPNLRLRTTVVKYSDGISTATFCSEIRMGGTQPAQSAAASSAVPSNN